MNFRSLRVVISAVVLVICFLGFLIETLRIQDLGGEADSLVREVHGANFNLAVSFVGCALACVTDQPELAAAPGLRFLKSLFGQGEKLKQLQAIYVGIKTATQWQRFFAVTGVIAAAVSLLSAIPFGRNSG